ncbi:MAG TPA: hypothetical protein VKU39_10855 [Streptosporangiaceae bacterium]|nr:hypothetical protein [Streptosporangiaceae bacterium]
MDDEQIAAHFEKHPQLSGLTEVYKSYTATFTRKNGQHIDVVIQILQSPEGTWTVQVWSEDGKLAASNPNSYLEVALATVHWEKLE